MANAQETLEVLLNIRTRNADKINKQLNKVASGFEDISKWTDVNINKTKKYQQAVQNQAKSMKMSLMGVGFGLLFQGMAIQRFFGGLARSMVETYSLAQGQNSSFVNSTNMIAGAWEFLKFSIMDALMQTGVVDIMINGLMWLLDIFNEMSPSAKALMGILVGGMAALGTIMMVGGNLALGMLAFKEVFGANFLRNAVTNLLSLNGVVKALSAGLKIGLGLYVLTEAIEDIGKGKWLAAIGDALVVAGLAVSGPIGGAIAVIGLTLKLLGDKGFRNDLENTVMTAVGNTIAWFETMYEKSKLIFRKMGKELLAATATTPEARAQAQGEAKLLQDQIDKFNWDKTFAEKYAGTKAGLLEAEAKRAADLMKPGWALTAPMAGANAGYIQDNLMRNSNPKSYTPSPSVQSVVFNMNVSQKMGESTTEFAERVGQQIIGNQNFLSNLNASLSNYSMATNGSARS